MNNTREAVAAVVALLRDAGIACDLFGGWAEDILGLRPPSAHGDIDLLYQSDDFALLDRLLAKPSVFDEVRAKRFRHKRAFQVSGILCEITLVQGPDDRPVTLFWGDVPFAWDVPLRHPSPVWIGSQPVSLVSAANLRRYREHHALTQPHRWREPQSRDF